MIGLKTRPITSIASHRLERACASAAAAAAAPPRARRVAWRTRAGMRTGVSAGAARAAREAEARTSGLYACSSGMSLDTCEKCNSIISAEIQIYYESDTK